METEMEIEGDRATYRPPPISRPGKRNASKDGASIGDRNKKPAWRGRAQQILLLKSKVKKLLQELKQYKGEEDASSKRKERGKKGVVDVDQKVQEEIAAISNARKMTMESMGKEFSTD